MSNVPEKACAAEKTFAGKPEQADGVEQVDLYAPPVRWRISFTHALTALTKARAESGVKKPKTPSRPLVRSVSVPPKGAAKRGNRRASVLARERIRVTLNCARILP